MSKKRVRLCLFLLCLTREVRQGVSVHLLHAKEPGEKFCNDFDSYLALLQGLERIGGLPIILYFRLCNPLGKIRFEILRF